MRAASLLLALALLTGKPLPASPVNLNSASAMELKTLPGLGDSMAAAILHYREKNGPFKRVEELLIIKNVSKKKLAAWKPYLKLN